MADRNRGIIHDTQLDERAEAIRGAQTANFNSAERVGSLFADIIQYIDDHEEEWLDKGSGDGSVPSGMGGLISSLWVKDNPADADQILHWDGSKWEYITTPSGGTGGGISLSDIWNSLNADNSSNQIHQSHLAYVTNNFVPRATFNATKWWGNTVNTSNNTVTGNLVGNINSITFGDPNTSNYITLSYEIGTNALKVSKGDTGVANFYATGGVSALGYSAGGSSGGEDVTPANLNNILSSVNSSEAPLPSSLSSSSGILYNPSNSRWEVKDLNLGDLKNVVISSNLTNGQGLVYNGTNWVNGTVSSQEGVTTLAGLTDTTITTNSGGQILYRNGSDNWENRTFSISNGSISFGSSNYTFITSHQSLSNYLKSSDADSIYAKNTDLTTATNKITTLEGYFTNGKANDADKLDGNNSDYFATATDVGGLTTRMTAAEGRLATAENDIDNLESQVNVTKSAWGNTYLSNGQFQDIGRDQRANINNAGNINMGWTLAMEYDNTVHDPAIYMKSSKTESNLLAFTLSNSNTSNHDGDHLAIGYGTSAKAQLPIKFFGRHFLFNYTTNNIDSNGNYSTEEAMMIGPRNIGTTANPVEEPAVYVRKHLMVGDGNGDYFPVTYDYANNALCFSGNIYATGGVSALGFSSTANGGATINGALEVNGTANLKSDVTVKGNETVEGNSLISGDLTVDSSIEVTSDNSGSTFITGPYISADSISVDEVDTTNITVNSTTTLNGNSTFTVKNNSSTPVNITIKYNGVNYTFNMQKAIDAGIFVRS